MKSLEFYFTSEGQSAALHAYTQFAEDNDWDVGVKMRLYSRARAAFDPATDPSTAMELFIALRKNLVSQWQVFRPAPADQCWSAQRIYEVLTSEFADFAPTKTKSPGFLLGENAEKFLLRLDRFADIKPHSSYPVMTVSKFLHFFNPALFPIYDTKIIENKVFRRFRRDYRAYCNKCALSGSAGSAAFYRN